MSVIDIITYALAGVLIALQVRDYKTTLDGFKHGAKEVGPPGTALDWSRKLMENLGLGNGLVLAKIAGIAAVVAMTFVYYKSPSVAMPIVFGGGVAYYAWVIVNNIRVKQRLKNE